MSSDVPRENKPFSTPHPLTHSSQSPNAWVFTKIVAKWTQKNSFINTTKDNYPTKPSSLIGQTTIVTISDFTNP